MIRNTMFLLFFLVQASVGFAADSISGQWSGSVTQPGYGSYDVVMTLDAAGGGKVEYPTLGCGGSLSGSGTAGIYEYQETITYGGITPEKKGCISGGTIHMVLQGEAAFWEWKGSYESESYYASGKLHRQAGSAVKGCGECGEALFNDVATGFDPSRDLRNYVHEARQNYANCTGGISDGCAQTCGRQLYDNLPRCEPYDAAGFKACVETTHRGAELSCS